MTKRIDYASTTEPLQALFRLERYVRECGLDHGLVRLMKMRASYINGCAYCIDMHSKDARAAGETEQRLYGVAVWRETPYFNARERAALAYTEVVTQLSAHGVSDADVAAVRAHFSEKEVVDLTFVIVAINSWNRLAVALGADVGSYKVGQHG
ncbi:MAG: carboxymuconolactone decarboxylase family protein [Myxococcota bacterium]